MASECFKKIIMFYEFLLKILIESNKKNTIKEGNCKEDRKFVIFRKISMTSVQCLQQKIEVSKLEVIARICLYFSKFNGNRPRKLIKPQIINVFVGCKPCFRLVNLLNQIKVFEKADTCSSRACLSPRGVNIIQKVRLLGTALDLPFRID